MLLFLIFPLVSLIVWSPKLLHFKWVCNLAGDHNWARSVYPFILWWTREVWSEVNLVHGFLGVDIHRYKRIVFWLDIHRYRGIGIRIEDEVLITETGHEVNSDHACYLVDVRDSVHFVESFMLRWQYSRTSLWNTGAYWIDAKRDSTY